MSATIFGVSKRHIYDVHYTHPHSGNICVLQATARRWARREWRRDLVEHNWLQPEEIFR